jgi:SAM-dependent methyltransferase
MGAPLEWVPETVDTSRPSAARMYDYYLGGAHNFGVDRELAKKALALFPDGQLIAQANRAFLRRAVGFMLDRGVRQFLDIGSGIPTSGNVHEIAQQVEPGARVLYVDHDPVAVAHSELLLRDNPDAGVLQADVRRPDEILGSPQLHGLLDLSRPVGVLMVAVLHFVAPEDEPEVLIRRLREVLAPGSYLAISHGTGLGRTAAADEVMEIYKATATPLTFRTHEEVRALFEGWDLVEPGVVWVPEWRPEWPDEVGDDPAATVIAAGVGHRP